MKDETPGGDFFPENVRDKFIDLNRRLAWANTSCEWTAAALRMYEFLEGIESTLRSGKAASLWSTAEQAQALAFLMTALAETGQYRHEAFVVDPSVNGDAAWRRIIEKEYMPSMGRLRDRVIAVANVYFSQPVFDPVAGYVRDEILSLLMDMGWEKAPQRYMPFRVIRVGDIVERIFGFSIRTKDPYLAGDSKDLGLLRHILQYKYLRFGTSGVRGRWDHDFNEKRAKQVAQAICDFLCNSEVPTYLKGEDLRGKRIVIGYDSRLYARQVAEWIAQVCLANGFMVDLANRDTPTPALVYHMTDYLKSEEVAGLINCTASHNPPDWQGIKFNPRQGWPAPTNLTDFIAARINEIQILDRKIPVAELRKEIEAGHLRGFDPIDNYTHWILDSENSDNRITIDPRRIRRFFGDRLVVVDEMHGAGRGYLTRLLGEMGLRHTVIHSETDPLLSGLDYANPEEPFINPLKEMVTKTGAALGLGLDTDADRFGIVDQGGKYFRPNQILPMLVRYLGIDRGLTGRIIATQTGSPLIDVFAALMTHNEANRPAGDMIPAYIRHPFYLVRVGKLEDQGSNSTFKVPVGIKYIEEQRRTDNQYRMLSSLPVNWRDTILIGGEESSGLTTKGHVTDKDGVWANLLVMDMLAFYGTERALPSITDIWEDACNLPGCWHSYGGLESEDSNTGRRDIDAVLEAKEELINHFLDHFCSDQNNTIAGLKVSYCGGVRYDLVELELSGNGGDHHFLRIRSSGTEPINRVYVESSSSSTAKLLIDAILGQLESFTITEVTRAKSEWRVAEILAYSRLSVPVLHATLSAIGEKEGWSIENLISKLKMLSGLLEGRNQRIARLWIDSLTRRRIG